MVRAPDWTEREFDTLLVQHQLSDEDLSELLPGRSAGAVRAVRAGLHAFHRGGHPATLSRMMLRRLEARPGACTCATCGARLQDAGPWHPGVPAGAQVRVYRDAGAT